MAKESIINKATIINSIISLKWTFIKLCVSLIINYVYPIFYSACTLHLKNIWRGVSLKWTLTKSLISDNIYSYII